MNPEVKAKWLAALRSGDYEQGRDALRTGTRHRQYCCLGVLCDLAVKEGIIGQPILIDRDWTYGDTTHTSWSALPLTVAQWAGLYNPDDLSHTSGFGIDAMATSPEGDRTSLSSLNDSGKTFEQIADIIEDQL